VKLIAETMITKGIEKKMKFATEIDCLITGALEQITTNTRQVKKGGFPRDSTNDASYLLDVIYTDCKEEYYHWDPIEPAAKMRPLTSEPSVHENEISHNESYYPYCDLTTSTSNLLQGPNVSNDDDNEESIVTSKERNNYCYDTSNAKQNPRDLTTIKYSSIESETNTSMGIMNGGDGLSCFHKSRQFPTNTKIEFQGLTTAAEMTECLVDSEMPSILQKFILASPRSNSHGFRRRRCGSVRERGTVPPRRTPRLQKRKKGMPPKGPNPPLKLALPL